MPVILCCVLIFVVWFKYERDKANKLTRENSTEYWNREYKSNFVRKTELSDLEYIQIPTGKLPFLKTADPKINELQNTVQKLSTRTIVNLTGLSNTDLKCKYGAANLTPLTEYDENYTLLVRTLYQWGTYLYENNYKKEAVTVLEYGITLKTDVSGNYKLLAQIYKENGDNQKIRNLMEQALTISSMLKDHIVAALNELLDQ